MIKCMNCERELYPDQIKKVKVYVGDYGSCPEYETWGVCPYCGSTDIDYEYEEDEEEDELELLRDMMCGSPEED